MSIDSCSSLVEEFEYKGFYFLQIYEISNEKLAIEGWRYG